MHVVAASEICCTENIKIHYCCGRNSTVLCCRRMRHMNVMWLSPDWWASKCFPNRVEQLQRHRGSEAEPRVRRDPVVQVGRQGEVGQEGHRQPRWPIVNRRKVGQIGRRRIRAEDQNFFESCRWKCNAGRGTLLDLESMSLINFSYASLCYAKIEHYHWLKLVAWLRTSNQSALFQHSIATGNNPIKKMYT